MGLETILARYNATCIVKIVVVSKMFNCLLFVNNNINPTYNNKSGKIY